jgi:hypothetical protein
MDCHKKLYCFKILFDKGVHEHARQILDDVLNISAKHYLHNIYLEAVGLKNTYFPLTKLTNNGKIQVNTQIKKLRRRISRNLYINQYLLESRSSLHDSDLCFRRKLIDELIDFDLAESEFVIDRLIAVNHLFYRGDFQSAHSGLLQLTEMETDISEDVPILGVIYIELVKACLCLHNLEMAKEWMNKAESTVSEFESFANILLELRFIISLRSLETEKLYGVLERTKQIKEINESEVFTARWLFYSLLLSFQKRDFKKVIKIANANSIFILKHKSWLINVKILEVLSIYQLEDSDWLHYKIESLRKILNGVEGKHQRFVLIINLFKSHLAGKHLAMPEIENKIFEIEEQFPWDPLGNEVINFCECIKSILKIDISVSLVSS